MPQPFEFWLFLPQMRMTLEEIVSKARAAERAGFGGMAGMDHMAPPMAEHTPMYEAMITNTWLAAQTHSLRLGSLVLCDAFRHPAALAREAVTIDHASGGRYELGIGWGSVPTEFATFGVGSTAPHIRVGRLKETLEIIRALWTGEIVDYEGEFFHLQGARQLPVPEQRIPIVIGGAGKKTMELVAGYADWWNVHIGILDKLEAVRPLAGDARCSLQIQVAYVPSEDHRREITETARRRFGKGPIIGTAPELADYFAGLSERGVERAYVWFCDFARPETLAAFGEEVIRWFSASNPSA